jgi:hypothetical protein
LHSDARDRTHDFNQARDFVFHFASH